MAASGPPQPQVSPSQPFPVPSPQQQQQQALYADKGPGVPGGAGIQGAGPPMPAPPHTLTAVDSFNGHSKTIFTMCFDKVHKQLVSGGKDGNVIVWSDQGAVVNR